jgi:hypothetical protein
MQIRLSIGGVHAGLPQLARHSQSMHGGLFKLASFAAHASLLQLARNW